MANAHLWGHKWGKLGTLGTPPRCGVPHPLWCSRPGWGLELGDICDPLQPKPFCDKNRAPLTPVP